MTGAILPGLILLAGGALLEWGSYPGPETHDRSTAEDVLLLRDAGRRRFTRTSRLLQALGAVLVVIGLLALML